MENFDWNDVEEDAEDEESFDVGPIGPAEFDQVVTYAFDWTVDSILPQLTSEIVDINVRFQRRDAWDIDRKSRYIQSVLLGIPVPQIVLAEQKEEGRRSFLVIDGRQRLLTLMQFVGKATGSVHNGFRLHLPKEQTREWNRLSYESLPDDLRSRFTTTPIRTTVLRNWKTQQVLQFLFQRLNTQTVSLNAQELRLAVFGGPFVHFLDDAAVQSRGVMTLMGTSLERPEPRMKDVELLLRYYAYRNCMELYRGPIAPFLDETCRTLNSQWKMHEAEFRKQLNEFESAVDVCLDLLKGEIGRIRPAGGQAGGDAKRANRNRAVMDSQIWLVAQVHRHCEPVDRAKLATVLGDCTKDQAFLSAVAATPRHKVEGRQRFEILAKAYGLSFPTPTTSR